MPSPGCPNGLTPLRLWPSGLCDTLDGFGGGWTKAQILKIMRDSRNGSYATMGGCIWVVAKAALLATIGGDASVWALRASVGAGPCLVVAQCLSRASAGGSAAVSTAATSRRSVAATGSDLRPDARS